MFLSYVVFITSTLTVLVQCHDCKDYDLSASDQSLVDMMKHYLHTSRKEECPPGGKPSTSGMHNSHNVSVQKALLLLSRHDIAFFVLMRRKATNNQSSFSL